MIPELNVVSDDALPEWDRLVSSMVQNTVDEACLPLPLLNVLASTLVCDTPAGERSEFRFFGMAVLGAIGADPLDAVPVAACSRLWWAGAEALDDVMDGETFQTPWSPERAMLVGTSCLAVLPVAVIHRAPVKEKVREYWLDTFIRCSLDAAEGQLQDLAHESWAITWKRVMSTYVRKTGAAYGAEAAMAARIATDDKDTLRGWRTFGQIMGVLRQLHNDNAARCAEEDDDLANGTPTLLLAHAVELNCYREQVLELREAAQSELGARAALRTLLHQPQILEGYHRRVTDLHVSARQLLASLTTPSKYRRMLQIMLDVSAAWAIEAREVPV